MLKLQKLNGSDLINSCLDQSLVSSSWKKAETKACSLLSQRLGKEKMDKPDRISCMQYLGKEFVQKYFPEEQVAVAESSGIEGKQPFQEMRPFISNILESSSERKGSKGKKKFPELSEFYQDARGIVDIDYERQNKQQKQKKGKNEKVADDTTLKLLSYDHDLVKHFCLRFVTESASLPDKLRLLLWTECVSLKEKPKNQGYENFQKGKKKFLQLLRKRSSFSQNSNSDVSEIVEKTYQETPALKFNFSEDAVQFITDVVTLYYSYKKKTHDCSVLWAIPMQHLKLYTVEENGSEDDIGENDDENDRLVTVAVVLEKTLRLCAPGANQLFDIAVKILEVVEEEDKVFIAHLKEAITVNISSKIKDFPKEILYTDKKKSLDVYQSLSSDNPDSDESKKVIQPNLFLRKWIYEGFVSILAPSSLLYVWDQLFLNSWSIQCIQNFCLCLLGLLRPWFMVAHDYSQIRKVFLEEPSLLYTLDIRNAFRHIQKKGKFGEISAMNRNIEHKNVPLPKRELTPAVPTPPPPKVFAPWVPYKKEVAKSQLPAKTKVDHPFDLYIDGIRFMPDNSTIVKVTAKILNIYLEKRDKSVKIQGYPLLESFSRYPQFNVKETINKESLPVNPDVVIMFRIYTVESHSKKQAILGSCLFCPFSNKRGKQPMLRVGGHQIRVHHGIPDPDFTVEHMLASHMDNNPIIPGVTILIRVLPHENEYVHAPEYESNVYRSELARPNGSEIKLFKHYQDSKDFQQTVRDVALKLSETSSPNDDVLMRMINQLFTQEGSEVDDFPYQRFVNYDKQMGLMVLVDKAAGLPMFLEGRYLQCLVQSFPGQETTIGDGKSQVKSFITEELDLESPQRAPDWIDDPTRLNPDYDDRAYLLLTLYGLRPQYDPSTQKIVGKDGKVPRFGIQNGIAWSVVPCFDKQAVFAGTHHVPLLKGRPTDDIAEKLSYLPLDYVCKKFKSTLKVFDSASIEVTIWDGRFTNDECPPLPTHTDYLNVSPNPNKYFAAKNKKFGETVVQLLRSGMLKSARFTEHQEIFLSVLKQLFKDNMDKALEDAGYSQLL